MNVGVAAHITAAAPGGPRYAPNLLPEERSGIENAIWLCQTCAKLIDNDPVRFDASTLRDWKQQAERMALQHVGKMATSDRSEREGHPHLVLRPVWMRVEIPLPPDRYELHRRPMKPGNWELVDRPKVLGVAVLNRPGSMLGPRSIAEQTHARISFYRRVPGGDFVQLYACDGAWFEKSTPAGLTSEMVTIEPNDRRHLALVVQYDTDAHPENPVIWLLNELSSRHEGWKNPDSRQLLGRDVQIKVEVTCRLDNVKLELPLERDGLGGLQVSEADRGVDED